MANFLLSIEPNSDGNYYFSNFGEALIYALIGFAVVLIGIIIIIFVIWLIGLILRKTNNFAFLSNIKIRKKQSETQPEQKPVLDGVEGEVPDEVKVAIITAIMAYYGSEKPQCEFKVRRIKRI